MTVGEVSTPPHVRHVDPYPDILEYPLSMNRNTRRAEHVSSKHVFPPIGKSSVIDQNTSPRRGTDNKNHNARPNTAQFFEAAKVFHASKDQNKELRRKLMESHMTFMNWRIPASRSASAMSKSSPTPRPGTSAQKLLVAKENAKKSPFTKAEVPPVETEKILCGKDTSPKQKKVKTVTPLSEKDQAVLSDWLTKASASEKLVIQDMIECADRLTLVSVTGRKFKPGVSEAIRLWLNSANDAEKQIAQGFMKELEIMDLLASPRSQSKTGFKPLMERTRDIGYRSDKWNGELEALFDNLSKELNVAVTRPFATLSPRHAGSQHFGSHKTPAALWHLDNKRDVRYSVENNTSSFLNPSRDRGSHFDIHPEWPSYC